MGEHDPLVAVLRHLVATIAFRATVAVRGFPVDAATTAPGEGATRTGAAGAGAPGAGVRTPLELLSHVADLMETSVAIVRASGRSRPASDASWHAAEARLYAGLAALDAALVEGASPDADVDALVHGPLADALTHVGQLLLMRRLSGAPAGRQGYLRADVRTGVVGPDQPGLD